MTRFEPEIIAFCTCGWESRVCRTGIEADVEYGLHARRHAAVSGYVETCPAGAEPGTYDEDD